jgi:hypothetical protein
MNVGIKVRIKIIKECNNYAVWCMYDCVYCIVFDVISSTLFLPCCDCYCCLVVSNSIYHNVYH